VEIAAQKMKKQSINLNLLVIFKKAN